MNSNQNLLGNRFDQKTSQTVGMPGGTMGYREFVGIVMLLLLVLAPCAQAQVTLPKAASVGAPYHAPLIVGNKWEEIGEDSASMAARLHALEAKFAELQTAEEQKTAEAVAKSIAEQDFQEVSNTPNLEAKFDNGWMLQSPDKAFKMKAGVEAQLDFVGLSAEESVEQVGNGGIGPVDPGVNIRRGRFDVSGKMYENFEFQVQYDFNLAANVGNASNSGSTRINSPQPTEFWGMFTQLPFFGEIRIGNQKPLWSFENWTSSRYQNFMERSLGWDAFTEDQNNGYLPSIVMLNHTENERMTYQTGVGKNNRSGFFSNTQEGNYLAEGRVTWLPYYADDGRYFVHLGLGGMYADADNGNVRFRSRTLLRNGSNQVQPILTEANFLADNESRLVPELVINMNTWFLQAEYYAAWAGNARTKADPNVGLGTFYGSSYYVQVMHYLTGEHNPYNTKLGRFERLVPNSNFYWLRSGGKNIFSTGAWLTGIRYSWVDLTDLGGVNGSNPGPSGARPSSASASDVSWAVNWIVNPNTRIIWDAIYEHRTAANTPDSNGDLVGLGMRLHFDY